MIIQPPYLPLTATELKVLNLLAQGLSDHEIQATMKWGSISTAETHVRHVRQKMGARNRAHAVYLAVKTGLLS